MRSFRLWIATLILIIVTAGLSLTADTGAGSGRAEELTPAQPLKVVRLYDRDWAIVIGINSYQTLPPLSYAVNDASAFAQVLQELGVPSQNIFRLTEKAATKRGIESLLADRLRELTSSNDRVFIFFAGHGVTQSTSSGEEGYLMPIDADEKQLYATAISMKSLRDMARRLPAKHIFFAIDSCYSGYAVTRGVTIKRGRLGAHSFTEKRVVQVLTAGQRDQPVIEDAGHGLFTKYLLQGLQGAADINKDGVLTVIELGQWAQGQVIRESEKKQVPMFGTLDGEGQFVVRWDLEATSAPQTEEQLPDPWTPRKHNGNAPTEPPRELRLDEMYAAAGEPRIAIAITDVVDGKPTGQSTTEHLLESDLRASGLRVFALPSNDRGTTEAFIQSTLKELTRDGKAEILIAGRNDIRFSRKINVEGQSFYFYRPELNLRVIRASTKEVIASSSPQVSDDLDLSALSRDDAVGRAVREVSKIALTDLRDKLKGYWASRTTRGNSFDLVVKGLSSEKATEFERFMRGDPRVRTVKRRRFDISQANFEVSFVGTQGGFIDFLEGSRYKPKLLREEDHSIVVTVD